MAFVSRYAGKVACVCKHAALVLAIVDSVGSDDICYASVEILNPRVRNDLQTEFRGCLFQI